MANRYLLLALFVAVLMALPCQIQAVPSTAHTTTPFVLSSVRQVMAGSDGTNAMFLATDANGKLDITSDILNQLYGFNRSIDSTNQALTDYASVTYIEGCDVLISTSVAAGAYATSSPFTAGNYDQLTLFITKSGDGDATDSLYVVGSHDPTVSGSYAYFSLTADYAFAVDMTGFEPDQFFVTLPVDNYLPYLIVKVKNNSGGAITWTVRICGKSRHGE